MSVEQPSTKSESSAPPHRYTAALADAIETRWQQRWEGEGAFRQPNPGEPGFDASKPKFYCLDMFPYPSGAGLHVGHPEGYTATDIVCRYKRMRGFNVLHPMGWDAFGLPAEQYAIQTGVHPAITTRRAIDNFRRQLKRFGFCYDWTREFGTIDEDYYRWTQWVFLRIYDSWYDAEQGRARPIGELVREFESGEREPRLNPAASEYAGAGDIASDKPVMPWAEMRDDTRRMVVDSYRLAYVGVQTVNWCPKLGTALANEEVIDGRSERGGFPVFRKPLRQWMFRITAYAERLLRGLDTVDWPESTRTQQAEWIGKSEGAEIDFPIEGALPLRVFTTRPDTIFGATYMVVAPEHPLVDAALSDPGPETDVDALRAYVQAARNRSDVERQENKEKTGVFTGVYALNPATEQRIPVWTADYVLMGYGTGAIMAVPGQDRRDWDFARAFGLPIVRTVQPPPGFGDEPYLGDGPAVNSGFLDGLHVAEAKQRAIAWLEEKGIGRRRVNYRLRDWLFSRQRYWGEPFPIVWDERGRHHPVGDDALPVRLPELADYQPIESDEPVPLLAKATDWLRTTAGEAGVRTLPTDAPVTREANTMPGWAGSCWYYLRYCDPRNAERFVGESAERYWMTGTPPPRGGSVSSSSTPSGGRDSSGGVDLYIGGAEHAVLHLLYARFWHKVLFDLGLVSTDEPFARLFHQGLILSHAYQREDRTLVPVDEVEERGEGVFVERATGRPATQIVAKMSKSLRNVINPDDVIAEYGADTFRLYEMYLGPLEAAKPWNPRDITGLYRFLQRAWRLIIDEETGDTRLTDGAHGARSASECPATDSPAVNAIEKLLHRTIAKVGADAERLAFNTAIAAMIEFVNAATAAGGLTRDQADRFARTLAPFAPHMAEELWARLGGRGFVSHAPWPEHDEAMLRDDEVEIAVQIAGKVRGKIVVPADADAARIESIALADAKVREAIAGRAVRKVIVVPGRLVNIVVA